MTLLDSIRDAAQRLIAQRELDGLMKTCRHLLSARGEANSADLATKAIEHYRRLPDAAHLILLPATRHRVQPGSRPPCWRRPSAMRRRRRPNIW